MASAVPQQVSLPILYSELVPLSSSQHGKAKLIPQKLPEDRRNIHAVPLTVDEFVMAQRNYPIVFSLDENPVPLALMGLNEGVNMFLEEGGLFEPGVYVPSYIRRWPFMLVRMRPDAEELSLCFDPTSGSVSEEGEGQALFTDNQPSETTKSILGFCEQFEQAGARTAAFVNELREHDLLTGGEVSIQPEGRPQPFVYGGFQMVAEEKLRDLRGDVLRKMNQSGLLPMIYAHLFSLSLIRDLFARQMAAGKISAASVAPAAGA